MSEAGMDIHSLFNLKNKVALVTGGSRGIGFMISRGLLEAGAKVYITARKPEACTAAAEKLQEWGECIAVPMDVTDEAARLELCQHLKDLEGKLDILINNAGTVWGGEYAEYPQSAFTKVMDTNVASVFCLTRDLTPLLQAAAVELDPARVINIGSMEGLHVPTVHREPNYAYTASKAAVHHLTRHLAIELGGQNITVNAIAPGFFPSKMTDHVFENNRDAVEQNCLLGRVGTAEEMAGIVIYLSSRAGAYTNGAVIPVDGGTSINHQHARAPQIEQSC
ncbi:MAG: NAD(P)-dependent dehydrogenase (short-subunit alcohol dehydrogenase family) [Halioglobus sp.]|jgi:NAD(P)-dependent dehydrogenase (short-subunit alcohol dehydrogenase family)